MLYVLPVPLLRIFLEGEAYNAAKNILRRVIGFYSGPQGTDGTFLYPALSRGTSTAVR